MKKSFVILISSILISIVALGNDLNHVRTMFPKAADDESVTKELLQFIQDKKLNTAIAWAYKASLEAIMAKHESNVFAKLGHVKKSSKSFSKAVEVSPNEPEIRILRYITEVHIPPYLGYSTNLNADKKVVLDYIKNNQTQNPEHHLRFLLKAMIEPGKLSKDEIVLIQKFIA